MRLKERLSSFVDSEDHFAPLDARQKARVRVERTDVALRLSSGALLVSLNAVLLIVWRFLTPGSRTYLLAFCALSLALSAAALRQCWRWRAGPKPADVEARFTWRLVMAAHFYGWLIASLPVMLFASANASERLLIVGSCTGFIAMGLSLSVIPRAALGYCAPIVVGLFVAFVRADEPLLKELTTLLFFYAVFISLTTLQWKRLIIARILARANLERQQELTNLLLNDFEENANDWLWETDDTLRLQHVSSRLVEVVRSSEDALQGLPLRQLLDSSGVAGAGHADASLWRQINSRRPFRNIILTIRVAGEERCWSLSGKPIFHRNGTFAGYRGVGSDVTEKKRSEDRLSYLAMNDPLTRLPNRAAFQQAFEAALRELTPRDRLVVLRLDIDKFKSVNDTFGHAVGDELLQILSERLKAIVGPVAMPARLAGDEFAILCTGQHFRSRRSVDALAAKIVASLVAPYRLQGLRINLGVSIGLAIAPRDGAADTLRRAELALHRIKRDGMSGYRFYEAEMDERIEASRELGADLRTALERNELFLCFQPLVAADDGRIEGFEALVRWRHPRRGLVSPGEFIPLAEETGAIIPIGSWIIKEACRIAATWPSHLSVAVNLSPIQFLHSDLPKLVRAALADSGLAAKRLELEVTESVFLNATPAINAVLRKLRRMQVRLSLDDFGTGYSSLSYLCRISFDKVKIDQSFVRELPNAHSNLAVVRAIVDLAKSLGMRVTAEGVESDEQRVCLLQQGCHQFQGFFFSKPLPAEQAEQLAKSLAANPQQTRAA